MKRMIDQSESESPEVYDTVPPEAQLQTSADAFDDFFAERLSKRRDTAEGKASSGDLIDLNGL